MASLNAKPKCKVQVRAKKSVQITLKPKPRLQIQQVSGVKVIHESVIFPDLSDLILNYKIGRL